MRIKLTFKALDDPTVIPINYNYQISSFIYATLASASPEYSAWLHDKGYMEADGKPIKLFTFSKFQTPDGKIDTNRIILPKFSRSFLQIASPMLDDFLKNLIIGMFDAKTAVISGNETKGRFKIESVNRIDLPPLVLPLRCVMLSPMIVSTMDEKNGKLGVHYLRADDDRLGAAVRENLLRKFRLINRSVPVSDQFSVMLDQEYIARRGGPDGVSKLITIKEGHEEATSVRAIQCPLIIDGSPEMISTALDAGVGEKNSLGFGMIGVYDKQPGSHK